MTQNGSLNLKQKIQISKY